VVEVAASAAGANPNAALVMDESID
jgi:hypothetical protein